LSVLFKEQREPELLTTTGAALDPLGIGLARRLVVQKLQKAEAFARAPHRAKDAVTTHAMQRGRYLRHYLYPSLAGNL
jgi:hypothetical protein